jgi:hypothetical protein
MQQTSSCFSGTLLSLTSSSLAWVQPGSSGEDVLVLDSVDFRTFGPVLLLCPDWCSCCCPRTPPSLERVVDTLFVMAVHGRFGLQQGRCCWLVSALPTSLDGDIICHDTYMQSSVVLLSWSKQNQRVLDAMAIM